MMEHLDIHSNLYDYRVSFIDDFRTTLAQLGGELVYVLDWNVYRLYESAFAGIERQRIFFMDPVEEKKNMYTVLNLISFFQQLGVRKNWKVICFGGGITQDIATMASNLFLRNVDWYFFPTTLLSMCDSCIGGKCGINVGAYKNQIGVFYPPKEIFIDAHFIDTLSPADYLNGWGEILKFSLTSDAAFYEKLKAESSYIPCERITYYIHRGLAEKKKIIEADEFESDLRRVLNYGHTFGHALEAYTKHAIAHGTAVIWGIDVANYLAWKEGLIDESLYLDVKALIKRAFLTEEMVIDEPHTVFDLIRTDKKVRGNTLSFAMLDRKSHLIVHPMVLDASLYRKFCDYLETTHDYYRA